MGRELKEIGAIFSTTLECSSADWGTRFLLAKRIKNFVDAGAEILDHQ